MDLLTLPQRKKKKKVYLGVVLQSPGSTGPRGLINMSPPKSYKDSQYCLLGLNFSISEDLNSIGYVHMMLSQVEQC